MAEQNQSHVYNDDGKNLTTYVNYRVYNKNGILINDVQDTSCFSSFTYYPIDDKVDKIVIYHNLSRIPYGKHTIEAWIQNLNELGFPCSIEFDSYNALFTVKPSNFTKKFHFNSTLQLIRCLYESYICYVPEIYFSLISGKNLIDKFTAIQLAHLQLHGYKRGSMANYNHMITSKHNNLKPISIEEFKTRIEKSNYSMKDGQSDEGYLFQIWQGEQPKKRV